MRKLLPGFLLSTLCISLVACTDKYTICDTSLNVTLNGSFFETATGMAATPSALSVANINGTSILSNSPGRSSFLFALNPASDTSRFVISLSASLPADTLTFVYTTQVQTISANCGNINIHTLTSATTTKHTIDSLALVNNAVNTLLAQNIKLFY